MPVAGAWVAAGVGVITRLPAVWVGIGLSRTGSGVWPHPIPGPGGNLPREPPGPPQAGDANGLGSLTGQVVFDLGGHLATKKGLRRRRRPKDNETKGGSMSTDSVTRDIVTTAKAVLDAAMEERDKVPVAECPRCAVVMSRLFEAVDAYRAALLRIAGAEDRAS